MFHKLGLLQLVTRAASTLVSTQGPDNPVLCAGTSRSTLHRSQGEVKVKVYVAIASKNSSSLLSVTTTWRHIGWYETVPGKCASVYDNSDNEPAYAAFSFTDAGGRWGAAVFDRVDDDAMHSSNLQICVAREKFDYLRSGGDPGGPCKDGYFKLSTSRPGPPVSSTLSTLSSGSRTLPYRQAPVQRLCQPRNPRTIPE